MAAVISRTPNILGVIYEYKPSAHTPDYDPEDWLINPDLSGLLSVPEKYWKVVGDTVVEMNQSEKDSVEDVIGPTPVQQFVDFNSNVVDPLTNLNGPFLEMQVLENRRELFNDLENPLYHESVVPILGEDGWAEDHASRIDNIEIIHNKHAWHGLQIKENSYKKPKDVLFYYGWMNSFNSAINGWNNENVAQDMAKYGIIILGDGVQDPGDGDYANSIIIISRIKELNPQTLIFGYVTTNQEFLQFQTKTDQWDNLQINGIFLDESGYDFGRTRSEFNQRVNYVHGRTYSNIAFANAWFLDRILGTSNDPSYPNSTYNDQLLESELTENEWILLERFCVDDTYGTQYEPAAQWLSSLNLAIENRINYGINFAAVSTISNGSGAANDLFLFSYISSLMLACEGYGTSDVDYAAGTARVDFYNRPNTINMGTIFSLYPSITQDVNDSDKYHRYVEFGKLTLDFSTGAQTSTIEKFVND